MDVELLDEKVTGVIQNGQKRVRGGTSDLIYSHLKQDILTGKIEGGTLLSEIEIARQFGASRTPVRDALSRLACERVVVALPQRGHLVRTITFSEVIESFRVREILEVEAAGEAAIHATQADINEMRKVYSERHMGNGILWNYKIHVAIAKASGNRILADLIEEILILMQRLLLDFPNIDAKSEENFDPEKEIVDAIEARNPELARELMRVHMRQAVDNLLTNRKRIR
jgi:DNA-binding GntR family transcriptional regulator